MAVTLFLVSTLIFISAARKLGHPNQKLFLPHLDQGVSDIEKKILILVEQNILMDVLHDRNISKNILQYIRRPMTKKGLSIIANNDKYLKPLQKQIFPKVRFNITDDQKSKILRLVFRDDDFATFVSEEQYLEYMKRAGELITQDKALTKSLANQVFKNNQLESLLNQQQRVALLKILLRNPQTTRTGIISDSVVKDVVKEVENDNDLKDFYGKHKVDFQARLFKNS